MTTIVAYPQQTAGASIHVMQDSGDAQALRERLEKFKNIRKMASTQLSMGLLLAINGGLAIFYECYLANIGNAIWSGLCFFAIAGLVGASVGSSTKQSSIVLYGVWSGLSTLCAGQLFGMSVYSATQELEFVCKPSINEVELCDYTIEGRLAIDSVIAILAFFSLVASAVGTVLCCNVPPAPTMRVVVQNAQPVMNQQPPVPTSYPNPSFVPPEPYNYKSEDYGAGQQPPPYIP